MASLPTRVPTETVALRGGTNHEVDAASNWTKRVGVAVSLVISLGLVAVASSSISTRPLLMNLRASTSTDNGIDTSKPVWAQPPRAWEVESDPQPGPPAGKDEMFVATGPEGLKELLLQHFGVDESTSPDPPAPHPTRSKGSEEAKPTLEDMLRRHFGLDGPSSDSPKAPLGDKNPESLEELKHELKEQLQAMLQRREQEEKELASETKAVMTKTEFRGKINEPFQALVDAYADGNRHVQLTASHAQAVKREIAECIERAVENAVDAESGRADASKVSASIRWVVNQCVKMP